MDSPSEGGVITMPFARILVPLDGTRRSKSVLPYAAGLATRSNSKVLLLTVLPSPNERSIGLGERGAIALPPSAEHEAALEESLQILARSLQQDGLVVETEIRHGVPSQEILRAAMDWRCDVIAMATRANRGVKRLVLGSVAEEVLRGSRLPVLLIAA